MIINGGSRCNGAFFAKHLGNAEKNETVKLAEIRGLAAKNIGQALYEMKAVASGTPRCKNFFYHANLNPLDHEKLTPEQWDQAVDTLEKKLGLEGQARFVVEHEKHGRTHRHVVWSRIDVDRMIAIRMDNDFEKHQAVSRQLEREFGLEQGRSVLGPEAEKGKRPQRRPKAWETFRGYKSGVNVRELTEEITELWNRAENAEAFVSALEGRGYILAQGDSRNYCIVDRHGDVHSLARRVKGARAADVDKKLGEIDPKTLPHVKMAAAHQRELAKEGEQRRAVIEQEETRQQDAIKEAEENRQQAMQEAEKWRQAGLDEEQRREAFKQQADRQAEQAKEMEAQQERLEAYRAAMARQAETAKREAAQRQGSYRQGEIRNAHSRYGQALAQHYSIRDPYETLARSAMAEYGAFLRDRESLDRQIARTADPLERQRLELRKEIEAAEYMAITSERIAGQSEIIVGKMNSPEAVKQRERAKVFQEQAQTLRQEYLDLNRTSSHSQDGQVEKETSPQAAYAIETAPRTETVLKQPEQTLSAFKVEERTQGKPRGPEQNLADYVRSLPEREPRREFTKDELRNNPEARKAQMIQEKDDQNRGYALDNISRDMKAGKNLNSNDIRRLNRDDIEGLKRGGDKYLQQIVQQREQERERGRGLER